MGLVPSERATRLYVKSFDLSSYLQCIKLSYYASRPAAASRGSSHASSMRVRPSSLSYPDLTLVLAATPLSNYLNDWYIPYTMY